jgi:hypothetical protein
MMSYTRCEGRRRKLRGQVYGTFACGRKATHVVETRVGYTEHYYVCEDGECFLSVTHGYPASSRKLSA